jgi:hypothetical protein
MSDFKFPTVKLKTVDITEADLASLENKKKFLGVGIHDVKVTKLENGKPLDKDPSFLGVFVHVQTADLIDKKIYFAVPTAHLKYKGAANKSGEMLFYKKLADLFRACGEDDVTPTTVPSLITRYFSKGDLIGQTFQIKVGYTKMHLGYKDKLYFLADRDGVVMKGEDGEPLVQSDNRDEATAKAIELGFPNLQAFPEVVAYIRNEGSHGNNAAAEDESDEW